MSAEQWWRVIPPDIIMTDARARELLANPNKAKNEKEEIFCEANANTTIPKVVKLWSPKWNRDVDMPLPYNDD